MGKALQWAVILLPWILLVWVSGAFQERSRKGRLHFAVRRKSGINIASTPSSHWSLHSYRSISYSRVLFMSVGADVSGNGTLPVTKVQLPLRVDDDGDSFLADSILESIRVSSSKVDYETKSKFVGDIDRMRSIEHSLGTEDSNDEENPSRLQWLQSDTAHSTANAPQLIIGISNRELQAEKDEDTAIPIDEFIDYDDVKKRSWVSSTTALKEHAKLNTKKNTRKSSDKIENQLSMSKVPSKSNIVKSNIKEKTTSSLPLMSPLQSSSILRNLTSALQLLLPPSMRSVKVSPLSTMDPKQQKNASQFTSGHSRLSSASTTTESNHARSPPSPAKGAAKHDVSDNLEDKDVQIVELEYDYLAPDSLSAIQVLPFVRRDKGEWYLTKWWKAAVKWRLLTGVLRGYAIEKDKSYLSYLNSSWTSSAATQGSRHHSRRRPPFSDSNSTAGAGVGTNLNASAAVPPLISPPQALLRNLTLMHRARVIAIGDVHGCLDELLDLLREVQYRPGDLVLFLGDLVAKGPQSERVVELAMDIGALSVRGNHDEEVTRQFLKRYYDRSTSSSTDASTSYASTLFSTSIPRKHSSASTATASAPTTAWESPSSTHTVWKRSAPTNYGSPHFRIARNLDAHALQWMSQLPYVIRSQDLGSVFVHAGFMPGRTLLEQDEHVMMTIRSLDHARPTPRCILGQPWAAEWRGPLTAYYGHDAARGFQRYAHAVCTDTGCVYGGRLTAVLLPDETIVSVPAKRKYIEQLRTIVAKEGSALIKHLEATHQTNQSRYPLAPLDDPNAASTGSVLRHDQQEGEEEQEEDADLDDNDNEEEEEEREGRLVARGEEIVDDYDTM